MKQVINQMIKKYQKQIDDTYETMKGYDCIFDGDKIKADQEYIIVNEQFLKDLRTLRETYESLEFKVMTGVK